MERLKMKSIEDLFILKDKLGEGSFGICYSCISKENKKEYAMKIISKEKLKTKNMLCHLAKSEIKIQQKLDSSKIVKIKEYIENNHNIFIIQELCRNNSLSTLLKKRGYLTEFEVQNYTFQLIQGLNYLHSNKIIHRDIKTNNLLLDEKLELKIGDFGLSKELNEGQRLKDKLGTKHFMAPEIWNISEKGYSFEADIWSLGIVIYNLLTGHLPFRVIDDDGSNIIKGEFGFPEKPFVSKEAQNLIRQILVVDPRKRPSLIQIVYHDFFHKNKFPKYLNINTLNTPPCEEEIKEYDINNEDINENFSKEIINNKLYDLVVEYEDIKYENIENYVIKEINLDNYFNVWVTEWKESRNEDIFYYVLNNGLNGIIFKNINIKLILDKNSDKFYEITEDGRINEHNLNNYPEKLKKYIEKLLSFSEDSKEIIHLDSQDLSSVSNNEQLQNKISNEINELSESEEICSESSFTFSSEEKNNKDLIFVKDLIVKNTNYINIYLIFFSDNTSQIIFHEINKNIIEIIINDNKNLIGYIDEKFKYNNIIKLEDWKLNPNKNFVKRIKVKRKIQADDIMKKIQTKNNNNYNDLV